jgi:hypothetical protein
MAISLFFAHHLAAVPTGQIGIRFTDQCIELERKLYTFVEKLELYSILAAQTINNSKKEAMFSARAINYPNPMLCLRCGSHTTKWTSSFKYLRYWLTTKLGWGNVVAKTSLQIISLYLIE